LRYAVPDVATNATYPGCTVGVPVGVEATWGIYRNPSVAVAVGVDTPATADPETVVKNPDAVTVLLNVTGPFEMNPVADTTAVAVPVGDTTNSGNPQLIAPPAAPVGVINNWISPAAFIDSAADGLVAFVVAVVAVGDTALTVSHSCSDAVPVAACQTWPAAASRRFASAPSSRAVAATSAPTGTLKL